MIPSHDEAKDPASAEPQHDNALSLRQFVGPGCLIAGALLVGRIQVLSRLAQERRGVEAEIALWAPQADWAPHFVQALVMGVVASALVLSVGGWRRALGAIFASLVLLSALSGWPTAGAMEVVDESSGLLRLAAAAAVGALLLCLLAMLGDARPAFRRFTTSLPGIAFFAALGLGPALAWTLAGAANAPLMPVRQVVREVVTTKSGWQLGASRPSAPPRVGVLSPFKDIKLTSNEFDTGDKPTLMMPPPCEVSFEVGEDEDGVALVAAAQISYKVSDRASRKRPADTPSLLDRTGVESVAVRFEVLVDGQPVFDEVIRHHSGETGEQRVWRHVGGDQPPILRKHQKVTLRTSFADEATAEFFEQHPFECGFGDLVLERWVTSPRKLATRDKPNLLVVVMDTLRADRMSCYGYEKLTTPNLDALARRGLLFESAFSTASWTWPSTASLFTGLLPYEHGVLSNQACNLNLSYETVAEVLQRQGYSTAAISCNPLINRATHFDQGFESFDEGVHMRMSDEVIDEVEATLERLAETRFYLYLQLVDPHTPHRPLESELARLGGVEPEDYPDEVTFGVTIDGLDHYAKLLTRPEAYDSRGARHPEQLIPEAHRRWLSDRYDASVGTGDHYVGRILDKLRELKLDEKTIVVFTSDHGEELLDHNGLAHGHALWRELVHVPLIIAGPKVPRGVRIATELSNRHLAPTLAMLGGAELASARDAVNLLEPQLPARDVFYQTSKGIWNAHHHLELLGRRGERYVTHYAPRGGYFGQPPGQQGDARLFSIDDDPFERTNLMLDPNSRERARAEVEALIESRRAQGERRRGVAIPVGAAGIQALKDVGYIGSEDEVEQQPVEGGSPATEDR